jgi:hypothetical protein
MPEEVQYARRGLVPVLGTPLKKADFHARWSTAGTWVTLLKKSVESFDLPRCIASAKILPGDSFNRQSGNPGCPL